MPFLLLCNFFNFDQFRKKKRKEKPRTHYQKYKVYQTKTNYFLQNIIFHRFERLNGVYPDILTSKTEQQILFRIFSQHVFVHYILYKGDLFIRAWLAILEICSVLLRHRLHQSMYLYENNVRNYVLMNRLSHSLIWVRLIVFL